VDLNIHSPIRLHDRVFIARSNTGLVGSNPTRGIDDYVRLFYVGVAALRRADSLFKSPTDCVKIKKLKLNEAFH
jgi:hypothetical protein